MQVKRNVIIKCNGFILRKWLKKDIKFLIANADNRNVWINLKDVFPSPYKEEDAVKWLEFAASLPVNSNFAIVMNNQAIGGIGVNFSGDIYKYSAEIGYWLGENYWGKGIATEAVGRISMFIFDNFAVNRIFARVFEWNASSASVLEKNGFKLEGRLRKHVFKNNIFADELVYGLLKDEIKLKQGI